MAMWCTIRAIVVKELINHLLRTRRMNGCLFFFFKATSWKGLKVESALRMGLGLDQILSAKVK